MGIVSLSSLLQQMDLERYSVITRLVEAVSAADVQLVIPKCDPLVCAGAESSGGTLLCLIP
jgi:hypothetical protein